MLQRSPLLLARVATLAASAALLAALRSTASAQSAPAPQRANDATASATITGTVFDSLAGAPLAGALVQIAEQGTGNRVLTDTTGAAGDFEIAGVPTGSYIVGFFHPALDSLGLGVATRKLDVTSAAPIQVALAIPSASTIHTRLCAAGAAADSSGLLIGFVRDADSGAPLGGASVVVMWRELVIQNGIHEERREVPAKANDAGWYALCGVPADGPLTARAELGADATGFIDVTVPPRALLHRDFYIPRGAAATVVAARDSAAAAAGQSVRRGSARLAGVVRNEKGQPLSGAQLLVWGSGVTGSTQSDGTFALAGLPAGSQALEARYVGYAPERVTVDLVSNQTRSVTVTLEKRADLLNEVVVYGKRSKRSRDFTGFLQRSKAGFGHFLVRSEIEKQHPFQFTDLFRRIPGFMVVNDSGFGFSIASTRGSGFNGDCRPSIYIDGMRIYDVGSVDGIVMPDDIAAVEAYAGPAGAPMQYNSGPCGTILIWTGPDLGVTQE